MAKIPLCIESLEFQANQCYISLKRAMGQRKYHDLRWSSHLYKKLGDGISDTIKYYSRDNISNEEPRTFGKLQRTPRIRKLYERSIFQYLVGVNCSVALECLTLWPAEIVEENRKIIVDFPRPQKFKNLHEALTDRNATYGDISGLLVELRKGAYVEPLWKELHFVRRHYS